MADSLCMDFLQISQLTTMRPESNLVFNNQLYIDLRLCRQCSFSNDIVTTHSKYLAGGTQNIMTIIEV